MTSMTGGNRSASGIILPILALVAFMWLVELVDLVTTQSLDLYGIIGRDPSSLGGIVAAPFLHADFQHLFANSVPLIILGLLVAWRNPAHFWHITAIVVLIGGLGVWLLGPADAVTIGASGLVFGYLGYLLVAGFLVGRVLDVIVSIGVLLLYGSTLVAALPFGVPAGVSWLAHLTGALAGVFAATRYAPRRHHKIHAA